MDVIRTCNITVRFSKFTLNIKIYDEFIRFLSKLVWREILFFYKLVQGSLDSDGGEKLVNFGHWFLRELASDLGW